MKRLGMLLFLLAPFLIACGRTAPAAPIPTRAAVVQARAAAPTAGAAAIEAPATAAATILPPLPPTHTRTPTPLPTATATPLPTRTPSPTVTPDPYAPLSIEALAERSYGGGALEIVDTLEENDSFARYLIRYPSDGLDIYGFLSVPNEGRKFPVALVLHGYIDPQEYDTEAYTLRYADALTEAGYFVIHPNFRNYPPSDPGPNPFRIGYAVDVLNLIGIIREQSRDLTGPLRRADAEQMHLMGHSMGGGAALRAITVWPEAVDAVVLYGAMSGDEQRNFERIRQWSNGNSGDFELAAPPPAMRAISPIYHLERIAAAVSIHHSAQDAVVPSEWSDQLCALLEMGNRPVECFTYYATPHTFRGQADTLFIERMIDFFDRY